MYKSCSNTKEVNEAKSPMSGNGPIDGSFCLFNELMKAHDRLLAVGITLAKTADTTVVYATPPTTANWVNVSIRRRNCSDDPLIFECIPWLDRDMELTGEPTRWDSIDNVVTELIRLVTPGSGSANEFEPGTIQEWPFEEEEEQTNK